MPAQRLFWEFSVLGVSACHNRKKEGIPPSNIRKEKTKVNSRINPSIPRKRLGVKGLVISGAKKVECRAVSLRVGSIFPF